MKQADEARARNNFCQIFSNLSLCDLAEALPLSVVRDMNIAFGVEYARSKDFCEPCEKEKAEIFYEVSRRTINRNTKKYADLVQNHIINNNL